jgi:hypothetical protein
MYRFGKRLSYCETPAFPRLTEGNSLRNVHANMQHQIQPAQIERTREHPHHAPPSEIGHWVRTAGILSPLVIGELVKDPERKWRFIRVSSVAVALISEGLHAHRIQRERRQREAERQR